MLSGYTRLSFCIAVLMMETAEDVNLFIPMLVGVMVSRGLGGLINGSLYEYAIRMKHIPLISRRIDDKARQWCVRDVMHTPVRTLHEIETMKRIH